MRCLYNVFGLIVTCCAMDGSNVTERECVTNGRNVADRERMTAEIGSNRAAIERLDRMAEEMEEKMSKLRSLTVPHIHCQPEPVWREPEPEPEPTLWERLCSHVSGWFRQ
ncbi:MAG: hypothetical protein LBD36_01705 [Holosporales bacterium]|nr:hypothetical protein [Holosporales bacterium]